MPSPSSTLHPPIKREGLATLVNLCVAQLLGARCKHVFASTHPAIGRAVSFPAFRSPGQRVRGCGTRACVGGCGVDHVSNDGREVGIVATQQPFHQRSHHPEAPRVIPHTSTSPAHSLLSRLQDVAHKQRTTHYLTPSTSSSCAAR
jgi:hypothetical protein